MPPTPLIELLAATDCLFRPLRQWGNYTRPAEIVLRRDRFARDGLSLTGGGDAAERKRSERRLNEIEQSGQVLVSRRLGKRIGWKLTGPADWQLRAVCGLYGLVECLAAMEAIAGHLRHNRAAARRGDNLVPEYWLVENPYGSLEGGRRIVDLEERLAPSLCRGWLVAWSDCEGHVAYSLLPEGRRILERPPVAGELPEYDPDAAASYNVAIIKTAAELAAAKPVRENSNAIPLSAGLWPHRSRAKIPFVVSITPKKGS